MDDISTANLKILSEHDTPNKNDNYELRETVSWQISDLIRKIGTITSSPKLAEIAEAIFRNENYDPSLVTMPEVKPFTPAEQWKTRDKSLKEKPVEFINRVYADVLDGFYTTAHLNAEDPALYIALNNWKNFKNEGQRPSLDELNLPTKKEVYDRLLAEDPENLSREQKARNRVGLVASDRQYKALKIENN